MKVGYLGPKGTFSYEACNDYFDDSYEKIEYRTINDTIKALEENEIEKCIVPIENSFQGCVTEAIDTLIQNEDIIVEDELLLEIKQNLMANKECKLSDIKKVYSHTQALSQCRNFIETNLKNAKIISMESTAYAAKIVSEEEEISACIGNLACIDEYNLNLIEKNIQDTDSNKTRFWILSKGKIENKNSKKMSMIFSVKDKPGALYSMLEIFNRHNLNLTKIESRPAKTVLGEYYFLIDVWIENEDENKAIDEIKEKGLYVRILGKY